MGEAMKQMADVKYSLDDNIKQNFLEPLHHLQTKDLKEVMVGWLLKKLVFLSGWSSSDCPSLKNIRRNRKKEREIERRGAAYVFVNGN